MDDALTQLTQCPPRRTLKADTLLKWRVKQKTTGEEAIQQCLDYTYVMKCCDV